MNNESRVKFYIGDLANFTEKKFELKSILQDIDSCTQDRLSPRGHSYVISYHKTEDKNLSLSDEVETNDREENPECEDVNWGCLTQPTLSKYSEPFIKLLIETNNQDKKFNYFFGDSNLESFHYSKFIKSRTRNSNSGVILRCLNFKRHWKLFYNKPKDIPFHKKKNKVIWRGTTTGSTTDPANRFTLVKKYYKGFPNLDVGFACICQEKDMYKNYVKGNIKIPEMLQYKYIISVEGNDKDSGLNWKLNSNSLVLMAKPRVSSWLMETRLKPDIHYVLLKDDFSDLKAKYEWCKKTPDKCKKIIRNANNYMKQFLNKENEENIEIRVIKRYFELMKDYQ